MKNGRHRIQYAALELFANAGIENVSTRAIANRAGVSEGTLYRHFQTKDELALTIFLQFAQQLRERLEKAADPREEPARQIQRLVETVFAFAAEEPLAYEYITHRHPPMEELPPETRLPKDTFIDVVKRGFRGVHPVLGAAMIIGMIERTLFFLRQGLLDLPPAAVGNHVARAALRALVETHP